MNSIRNEFELRYTRWKEYIRSQEVALHSSDDPYVLNLAFQAIVQMGREAVPYIIEKLKTDSSAHFLVHALDEIFGSRSKENEIGTPWAQDVKPVGNQEYAAMWVDWWDQQSAGNDRD